MTLQHQTTHMQNCTMKMLWHKFQHEDHACAFSYQCPTSRNTHKYKLHTMCIHSSNCLPHCQPKLDASRLTRHTQHYYQQWSTYPIESINSSESINSCWINQSTATSQDESINQVFTHCIIQLLLSQSAPLNQSTSTASSCIKHLL